MPKYTYLLILLIFYYFVEEIIAMLENSDSNLSLLARYNEDWYLKKPEHFHFVAVTDERWNSFKTIETDSRYFKPQTSVSFSVVLPATLEFFVNDEDYLDYFFLPYDNNVTGWHNFSLIMHIGNVYVFQNNQLIRTLEQLVPADIAVTSQPVTQWKIHDYEFRWANTSTEDGLTTLSVLGGPWVFNLYTILCDDCYLEITSSVASFPNTEVKSSKNKTSFEQVWQKTEIVINNAENTDIVLKRRNLNETNKDFDQFWAVDVRLIAVESEKIMDAVKDIYPFRRRLALGNKSKTVLVTSSVIILIISVILSALLLLIDIITKCTM